MRPSADPRSEGGPSEAAVAAPAVTSSARADGGAGARARHAATAILPLVAMFALVSIAYGRNQPLVDRGGGLGDDGFQYHAVAVAFRDHTPIAAPWPFAGRIGVPWLAAHLFPAHLASGFLALNIVGNLAWTLALYALLARHGAWSTEVRGSRLVRLALLAWPLLSSLGPVRFVFYYPVLTDPWGLATMTLGLLLALEWERARGPWRTVAWWALVVTCALGTLVRETMLIAGLAALGVRSRPGGARTRAGLTWLARATPTLACLAACALVRSIAASQPGESLLKVAEGWMHDKTIWQFAVGQLLVFGPAVAPLAGHLETVAEELRARPALAIYGALSLAASWVGGQDTERLAHAAFPVVLLLVAAIWARHGGALMSPRVLGLVLVCLALGQRWAWRTPPLFPPRASPVLLLATQGNEVPLSSLKSQEMPRRDVTFSLAQWLGASALIVAALRRRSSPRLLAQGERASTARGEASFDGEGAGG